MEYLIFIFHLKCQYTVIIFRILELKSDIRKLDCSNYQFFGNGLVEHHVTTYDAEMLQLPTIAKRSVHIEAMIEKIFERAKEIREALVRKGMVLK